MRYQARMGAAAIAVLMMATACDGARPVEVTDPPTIGPGTIASPSGPAISGACSAANASRARPQQTDLPDPVSAMRKNIIEAAIDCDYERLAQLATTAGEAFQYSLEEESAGPESQPARFWEAQEDEGERVLVALVEILTEEPQIQPVTDPEGPGTGSEDTYYNWPPPEDPHPRGYETSITSTGDWIYFIKK